MHRPPSPVEITPAALREIRAIIARKAIPDGYALRIGMKGGGCGGMSFLLGFDHPRPEDDQYELNGLAVLIEKRHLMYLLGMQVDFEDSTHARGFVFQPAAERQGNAPVAQP